MKKHPWLRLAAAVIFCELVGIAGSFFTMPAITNWYAGLLKPSFSPPNWIFGPVWTLLYALMGISVWLFMSKTTLIGRLVPAFDRFRKTKRLAIFLFLVQLALNAFWSFIFFKLHAIGWAFIELLILWCMIALTAFYFEKVSKLAAWLLLPYLLWVTFAGVLNFSLWGLNDNFSFHQPGVSAVLTKPVIETPLPTGYSPSNYVVEEQTNQACRTAEDCETPTRYLLMSRCPFASLCIAGKCAVVCPSHFSSPSVVGE